MKSYYQDSDIAIYNGDALEVMKGMDAVNCVVTSPPYWGLRDYGCAGQLGLEATLEEYVFKIVQIFNEIRRVLRDDGTVWLNLGDCYAGSNMTGGTNSKEHGRREDRMIPSRNTGSVPSGLKSKDLIGIPWRVAFALQAAGWYLRSDIIWHKPNPMPESVTDRPTKAHEYLFLLSKSERYFYDAPAIAESATKTGTVGHLTPGKHSYMNEQHTPRNGKWANEDPQSSGRRIIDSVRNARAAGQPHDNPFGESRNKRSVWTIATQSYPEAHFATFPEKLVEPCILAGCQSGGVVLDPFMGSGTTLAVARRLNCRAIGIELKEEYCQLAKDRFDQGVLTFEAAL